MLPLVADSSPATPRTVRDTRMPLDILLQRVRSDAGVAVLRGRTAQPAAASGLLSPKRVLAVDDSPTFLDTLATVLQGEGYDVVLAHSGEECIAMLGAQPIDCILLDLEMPGTGGLETCRHIKAAPGLREIPLIILTGREDRPAMIDASCRTCITVGSMPRIGTLASVPVDFFGTARITNGNRRAAPTMPSTTVSAVTW